MAAKQKKPKKKLVKKAKKKQAIKKPAKKSWPPKGYLKTDFAESFGQLITDNNWPPLKTVLPPSLHPTPYYFDLVAKIMARLYWKVGSAGQNSQPLSGGPFYTGIEQLLATWPPVGQPFNVTAWDLERAQDLLLQALNARGVGGGSRQLPPGDGG